MYAHSYGNRTEPKITSKESSFGTFDTHHVRRQLGVSQDLNLMIDNHGIALQQDDFPSPPTRDGDEFYSMDLAFNMVNGVYQDGILICTNDCLDDTWASVVYMDARQRDIFLDTLQETENPALALQAPFTITTQMVYYDMLPLFDVPREAVLIKDKAVLRPVVRRGFLAIIALTLIHFILTCFSVISFGLRTQHTLLNNSWQVLTQAAEITRDNIVCRSTTMSDKAIRKELKEHRRDQEVWILAEINADGGNEEEVPCSKRVFMRKQPNGSLGIPQGSSISLQPLVGHSAQPGPASRKTIY